MLVLLLFELDVQDALADRQLAQFFDLPELMLAGIFGQILQILENWVVEVGILVVLEVLLIYLV